DQAARADPRRRHGARQANPDARGERGAGSPGGAPAAAAARGRVGATAVRLPDRHGAAAVRDRLQPAGSDPGVLHPLPAEWLPRGVALHGIPAVLGRVYSPYVRFKGGKGVATAAGMFLALAPLALAISLPIWGATLWLSGYVSAASLAAAALFPLWVRLTEPDAPYTFWASVVLALLIAYSHRGNIRRLIDGSENRFRTRKGVAA